MKKVYPSRYYFSQKATGFVLKNIATILAKRDFLTGGKYCQEFEARFSWYQKAKYALAVNSGTSALEAILSSLDIKGKEVIVTTNTFAATIYAILRAGAKPVFADILDDMSLDPEDAKRRLTTKTKAVVAVHIGGFISPAIKDLQRLCQQQGLLLIEDAAHAVGAAYQGKMAGSFGVAAAFSFFATKVMTTGEGGAVLTSQRGLQEKIMIMRDQGKIAGANFHQQMGWNWRLTEFQALLGLAQLQDIHKVIQKRQQIAGVYGRLLKDVAGIRILSLPKNSVANFYKYFVFLPRNLMPQKIIALLKARYQISLPMAAYDIPCHQQPVFRQYAQARLPNAEKLCASHICLPVYYDLTLRQVKYIVSCLRELIENK